MEPADQTTNTPNDNIPNTNQPQKPKTSIFRLPQSRNRKIILISAIAIFILLGLIMGLSLFSKNSPPKDTYNSPLDNPMIQKMAEKLPIPKITMTLITLAPTPTFAVNPQTPEPSLEVPAANYQSWKTYNNKTINFSLSYPSYLKVEEKDHGLGVIDITLSGSPKTNTQNTDTYYQILIYPSTVEKFIGNDFNTIYSLPVNTTQRMSAQNMQPQIFTKIKNRTLDSHRAFDFESTSDPADPYVEAETGTYIDLGKSRIIISTGKSNRATLDQMLITFKSPIKN